MTTIEKYVTEIMQAFREKHGRGSCYCLYPLNPYILIAQCIVSYFNKHDKEKTILIVVDSYSARQGINDALSKLTDEQFNTKVISYSYIKPQYHYVYDFTILCNVENDYNLIYKLYKESKFTLCIFTKNVTDNNFLINVRNILPNLETSVNVTDARADNIYSPVEEYTYGVPLSDDVKIKYNEYNEYITQSIKIYGSLDNIEKCRTGNPLLNISSIEFRTQIAKENGWNETLDTSIPLFKQIDDVYNPNALYDRAVVFYNIIHERKNYCTDNINKLEKILEICNNNKDKRILIVSKRGEFAAKITDYLNEHDINCVDYHDAIEDAMLTDRYGNPVLYKSGENAGKPRIVKAQAISTINEQKFQKGLANCISIKYSSNNKLNIAIDIVIITDFLNGNIVDIKSRFGNIRFTSIPTIVHRLYSIDTIEEKEMYNYNPSNNIILHREDKKVTYDEKSGNIIL